MLPSRSLFKGIVAGLCLATQMVLAQEVSGPPKNVRDTTINYYELYDTPYDLNKLWVFFQPVYGEIFVTNINGGFGLEAHYLHGKKLDFRGSFRKAYSRKFDLERDVAENNSLIINSPKAYYNLELGGTYHLTDKEEGTETKMFLKSSDSTRRRKDAAALPLYTLIPSRVRKIQGARLGFFSFQSATDLKRAMDSQNVTLVDENQVAIDSTISVFGNVTATGIYVGASLTWIKNFAVKPEEGWHDVVSDQIFTTYFDILIAPLSSIDDVMLNGNTFSTDPIATNKLGFRAGIEGKFNRKWGWAYNAEMGFRPSVRKRGFYALVKVSVPVYGSNLRKSEQPVGR